MSHFRLCIALVILLHYTYALDQSTEKRLQILEELDLSRIEESLTFKQQWTDEFAAMAVEEYRRFLALHIHYPEQRLVPSLVVDEVWHTHILFTRQYAEDCQDLFGSFLHHEPTLPSDGPELNQEDKDDYSDIVDLYTKTFGERPGAGWRGGNSFGQKADGATCGSCGSSQDNSTEATNSTDPTDKADKMSPISKLFKHKRNKPVKDDATCGSCGSVKPKKRVTRADHIFSEATCANCGSSCGGSKAKPWRFPSLRDLMPSRDQALDSMSDMLTSFERSAASLEDRLHQTSADDVTRAFENIFSDIFGPHPSPSVVEPPPSALEPFSDSGVIVIRTSLPSDFVELKPTITITPVDASTDESSSHPVAPDVAVDVPVLSPKTPVSTVEPNAQQQQILAQHQGRQFVTA